MIPVFFERYNFMLCTMSEHWKQNSEDDSFVKYLSSNIKGFAVLFLCLFGVFSFMYILAKWVFIRWLYNMLKL